jgi:hypothetical protein
MSLKKQQNGKYTLKTYTSNLYTWSPITPTYDKAQNKLNINNNFFCNATPGSQGQDNITTYVYNISVTPNGILEKIAYVECDYVN